MHPLFVKYRTPSGQGYFYDLGTGWIVQVDDTIYEILDDYRVLSNEEIRQKYARFDDIDAALKSLEELRNDNLLVDHCPDELCKVERIWFDKRLHPVEEFWRHNASLLILSITERCNLNCAYCCYSGSFEGQRSHSSKTMSREIGEKAILDYLGTESPHSATTNGFYPITFYGGEPLLELGLIKHLVSFAKEHGEKQDKITRFAITTNGTLLDDDAADFLVEHGFMVMVSFDGPKESHDRYRVFANGQGSFDTVYRNLKRFAERHPEYMNRGVTATLAPPLDLEAARKVIEEFFSKYPLSRASLANTGTEHRFFDNPESTTRYGCYTAPCEKSDGEIEGFRNYTEEDGVKLDRMRTECIESVKAVGIFETKNRMPFAAMLFEQMIDRYHRRPVVQKKPAWPILMPCFPGFTRRFCDASGNYRVCERVDDSETFKMGSVQAGFDFEKLDRMMEMRRHFGDCANCTSMKTCDICYARIPFSDAAEHGFDPLYDLQCQRTRLAGIEQLKTYTEIMESNPQAFDKPGGSGELSRLETMRYCVSAKPLPPETLEKLKCEKHDPAPSETTSVLS